MAELLRHGQKPKRIRTWVTLVACFVECFFFAGSIFGWPSMAYILQQDGIFAQQCPNETQKVNGTDDLGKVNVTESPLIGLDTGCDAQRSRIALAFTFATVLLGLMTFPNGIIFDKYGLRITRCLATGLAVSGHFMLAFSAPGGLSYLIYPGCILVGISCSIYIMTSFHICLLAGSRSSTMSALNSGAVNSGAAIFLIIKLVYGYGFPRRFGLMCLSVLYIYSLAITFFLLPARKVYTKKPKLPETKVMIEKAEEAEQNGIKDNNSKENGDCDLKDDLLKQENKVQSQEGPDRDYKNEMKQILPSSYYLLHVYWFAMVHLRVTFFCSCFNSWVEHLTGNDQEVSLLTNTYGYIQMCSVILCPSAGLLVDYFRRRIVKGQDIQSRIIRKDLARAVIPPLVVASISAASLCVCMLLETKRAVLPACFFVELTRAFLYVTMGTFTSLTFPASRFGVLFGITYAAGGLTTGLQYGLLQWSIAWSDYFYPNLVLMLAILLTFAHPANIYIRHLCGQRSRSL